ncbi:MAG: hypothetical protein Q9172_001516 [Xanthocarpia lactea]
MATKQDTAASEIALPDMVNLGPSSSDKLIATLEDAAAKGHTEAVRHCLTQWTSTATSSSRRGVKLQPALLAAVENNQPVTVGLLLDEGLHIGYEIVRAAISIHSVAILEVFLDHGWNINQKLGPTMAPALSQALEDADLVRWFLSHGANPNAAVPSWPSPLETAASKASLEVIEMLVQNGGRVHPSNALPWAGKTRLPDRRAVLAYLLDHGAPIDKIEFDHNQPIFRKFGMRPFGTALHHAAKRDNNQLVRFLLERGANRSLKDSLGKTAIQYAVENNLQDTISVFDEL